MGSDNGPMGSDNGINNVNHDYSDYRDCTVFTIKVDCTQCIYCTVYILYGILGIENEKNLLEKVALQSKAVSHYFKKMVWEFKHCDLKLGEWA